jgi:hypothetical protein
MTDVVDVYRRYAESETFTLVASGVPVGFKPLTPLEAMAIEATRSLKATDSVRSKIRDDIQGGDHFVLADGREFTVRYADPIYRPRPGHMHYLVAEIVPEVTP